MGLGATVSMGIYRFIFTPFCISYLFYATFIFTFSLLNNKRYKLLFKTECFFVVFLFLLSLLIYPEMLGGTYRNRMEGIMAIETLVVLGCVQLIPSKQNTEENLKNKVLQIILMFAYCIVLSFGGSAVWRR
jgi:hypothetical protein